MACAPQDSGSSHGRCLSKDLPEPLPLQALPIQLFNSFSNALPRCQRQPREVVSGTERGPVTANAAALSGISWLCFFPVRMVLAATEKPWLSLCQTRPWRSRDGNSNRLTQRECLATGTSGTAGSRASRDVMVEGRPPPSVSPVFLTGGSGSARLALAACDLVGKASPSQYFSKEKRHHHNAVFFLGRNFAPTVSHDVSVSSEYSTRPRKELLECEALSEFPH